MIGHRVALRPRSLLETGDLAFVFLREHWRLYARLLPWVVVPAVAGWVAERFAGLDPLLSWTLVVVAGVVGSGVYVGLCGELMLRPEVELGTIQRRFAGRLPRWIVLRALGAIVSVGSLLIAHGRTVLLAEAALLEEAGMRAAFQRSSALMRATPGRAVGFAAGCLAVWAMAALGAAAGVAALRDLFGFGTSGEASLAPYVGFACSLPYLVTMRFLLYIDCRTRREGWDLQVQMGALVTAAGARLEREPREAA